VSRVVAGPEGPAAWIEAANRLQGLGATYLSIGPPPGQSIIEALPRLIEAKKEIAAALPSP
jgi:hypothetical protein